MDKSKGPKKDLYNNLITYGEKWSTDKKCLKAIKALDRKYFPHTRASSHVPHSWAPEVLELLNRLDKEFGIQRDNSFRYNWWNLLLYWRAFKQAWRGTYQINWSETATNRSHTFHGDKKYNFIKALWKSPANFLSTYWDVWSNLFRSLGASYTNLKRKPGIRISQVKEKYGTLRVYYTLLHEKFSEDYVESLIHSTEIKLSLKLVYYPLESLAAIESTRFLDKADVIVKESSTGWSITRRPYRDQALKDLGPEIVEKIEVAQVIKESIPEVVP